MKKDMVSIVTPLYNSEEFILDTIKSVRYQTYDNWEMLIVDDCSTDASKKISEVESKNDSRIKVFSLRKNMGPAVARNLAIAKAKGKYLAFIDSDDLWKKEKLEKQLNFMDNSKYCFTYTPYTVIDKNKNVLKEVKTKYKVDYKTMLKKDFIGNSTVILEVNQFGKTFAPLIRKRNDYGLWLRILKIIDYAYSFEESLSFYRLRKNSVSSNKINLLKYNFELFHKVEKFDKVTSLLFTLRNSFYKLIDVINT